MAAATMMSSKMVRPAVLGRTPALPFRAASRSAVRPASRVQAVQSFEGVQEKAVQAVALSTLVGSFMSAGNAAAATELGQIAAGDNRIGAIALLFAPVVGWVLFNIGGPALNQLNDTAQKNKLQAKRSVAAGLGLTAASLLAAQSADAAEIAQVAAGDNRIGAILLLFAPVVGWVLFNIGGPALNQLNDTAAKSKDTQKNKDQGRKRGVAVGLGLTAGSMLAAQNADAAEALVEAAQKVNDNRVGIIATVFVPVIGWVLFNIYEGAKAQIDNMRLR
jgi:photosystem II PsbY protein